MESDLQLDLVQICKTMFSSKPNVPEANWVVYENGTVVYHEKSMVDEKQELIRLSNEAMSIPVVAATPSADFSVNRLNVYYPDEPIYAVTYSYPENMATIIRDGSENELIIGLAGREQRREDSQSIKVVATSKD